MDLAQRLEQIFFFVTAALVLGGGIATIAARNPIRSAMGLLTTIVGIAGMYLLLHAEFLAAIQILVYAGAVVVLFIFVIMLLGPSATSGADARGAIARYSGAGLFLAVALAAITLLGRLSVWKSTRFPKPTAGLGSVEAIGKTLFGEGLVVFELSGALLLVAVVGAVAVARGRQPDPTLAVEKADKKEPSKAQAEAR